jgi:hypothetical protein
MPLGFIFPEATSPVAFSRFIFDQMLRLPRGVYLSSQLSPPSGRF